MSLPIVRVNTFMKEKENVYIDPVTWFFYTCELAVGLNRVAILGTVASMYKMALALAYGFFVNCAILYISLAFVADDNDWVLMYVKLGQYIMCAMCGLIFGKRMHRYFDELKNFDMIVGCRPKIACGSFVILLQMIFVVAFAIASFIYGSILQFAPIHMVYVMEVSYYGHLFYLLCLRLRLINFYVRSSLTKANLAIHTKENEFIYFNTDNRKKFQTELTRLVNLYHILFTAFDILIDAIKWQLLFLITTSFCFVLMISHHVTVSLMHNELFMNIYQDVALSLIEIIPLVALCLCCDLVRAEVKVLRELLASRLNETKDKSNRNAGRALLALTEAQPLSFSLLRMLDISISLPFSFVGLLVTYLIIIVQFERVLSPDVPK